jgi:hypothetical protein
MAQIAANYVLMDRILSYYGPEASGARAALHAELASSLKESRQSAFVNKGYMTITSGDRVKGTMLDTLKSLSPKDDIQRFAKQTCLNLHAMALGLLVGSAKNFSRRHNQPHREPYNVL